MSFHSASDRVLRRTGHAPAVPRFSPALADNAHAEFNATCQLRDFATTADRRALAGRRLGNPREMIMTADTEELEDGRVLMRVVVDLNRCQGYAQCVFLAPDVFQLHGEEALLYDLNPDGAQRLRVLRAAAACPVQAIAVERLDETVTGATA
jgi:ferredoxin